MKKLSGKVQPHFLPLWIECDRPLVSFRRKDPSLTTRLTEIRKGFCAMGVHVSRGRCEFRGRITWLPRVTFDPGPKGKQGKEKHKERRAALRQRKPNKQRVRGPEENSTIAQSCVLLNRFKTVQGDRQWRQRSPLSTSDSHPRIHSNPSGQALSPHPPPLASAPLSKCSFLRQGTYGPRNTHMQACNMHVKNSSQNNMSYTMLCTYIP